MFTTPNKNQCVKYNYGILRQQQDLKQENIICLSCTQLKKLDKEIRARSKEIVSDTSEQGKHLTEQTFIAISQGEMKENEDMAAIREERS